MSEATEGGAQRTLVSITMGLFVIPAARLHDLIAGKIQDGYRAPLLSHEHVAGSSGARQPALPSFLQQAGSASVNPSMKCQREACTALGEEYEGLGRMCWQHLMEKLETATPNIPNTDEDQDHGEEPHDRLCK
jgi:hypothetical protein